MGKREKKVKSAEAEECTPFEEDKRKRTLIESVSSDDDADNEDLSLKIVQISMQRAATNDPHADGVSDLVTDLKEQKSKKEKKMRKKSKEIEVPGDAVASDIDTGFRDFCGELFLVDNLKDKQMPEVDNAAEVSSKAAEVSSEAVETNPVEMSENVVLRKLLRGPRYFDPPDNNSWGACYNCGEEGHTTVNCTSARWKKPCFVCGSLEHNAKQCPKGRDCFICKQQGHRAKDCPDRFNSSKMCLKCGDLGHDLFSCSNDYCPDDRKEIQCYICGKFGHLCCRNYEDPGPREFTCYRCGLSGHTGLACMASTEDTNFIAYASSCYKCGLVGHFARECTKSKKSGKRNRELSTPKQRSSKKNRDHSEAKSAPNDSGKTRKKKKFHTSEFASASRKKRRGGWCTEDPGDYYHNNSSPGDYYHNNRGKSTANHWRSPSTPNNRRSKLHSPKGDYASSSLSSKSPRKINFNNSPSNGSARFYQHKYSTSRFGNNSNGDMGRNNNYW